MGKLNDLATRLAGRVQDDTFPLTDDDYSYEIQAAAAMLGYEGDAIEDITFPHERIVLTMAEMNLYYLLAGKHAKNFRTRVEGDMEIHPQQVAGNYLELAQALEERLDSLMAQYTDSVKVIEATRWRVSDNQLVPHSDGSAL